MLATAALSAVFALLVSAGPAAGAHVRCGDVISADTTLDSDVVCEGETYGVTAITIAADGVTLDLGGHAVRGAPAYEVGSNGIATDGPRRGVTIRGGTVVGFAAGVYLQASSSVVERMSIRGSGGAGIWTAGDGNLLRRNDVRHFGEYGVRAWGDRTTLDRNRVEGPITCVRVSGERPTVTHNRLAECYWAGGIDLYTSAIVAYNLATGNASGFGASGEGARIVRNDFSGNEGAGLSVVDPHAIIDRNTASDNYSGDPESPSSGIEVHVPGAVVSRNRADRNENYGIHATAGTIDGGGNRARGNGNPAQCLNVVCRK